MDPWWEGISAPIWSSCPLQTCKELIFAVIVCLRAEGLSELPIHFNFKLNTQLKQVDLYFDGAPSIRYDFINEFIICDDYVMGWGNGNNPSADNRCFQDGISLQHARNLTGAFPGLPTSAWVIYLQHERP